MTERIYAITGDTHADEPSGRLEEHDEIMRWIAYDAKGRGACALLHSGDVYERASTPRERESVIGWVREAAQLFPVAIVAGNHDDPRDIEALGKLRTKHPVRAETRPGPVIPLEDARGTRLAWIATLPWPRKAYLLAGEDLGREQANAAAQTALKNILRAYGDTFLRLTGDEPRIFLGHVMMRGSRVGPSQPPLVGADFELGIEDLALCRADFYALGHIHLAQAWATEERVLARVPLDERHEVAATMAAGAPIVYPGDPRRTSFGELDDKSYVLATFHGRQLLKWERIPTPCRPMIALTGRFVPAGDEPPGLPPARLQLSDCDVRPNAEVRLRYECRPEERAQARALAEYLADNWINVVGAHSVKIEDVVLTEHRARAPEVALARTHADRLQAFWSLKQVPERRAELLAKLEVLESEAG